MSQQKYFMFKRNNRRVRIGRITPAVGEESMDPLDESALEGTVYRMLTPSGKGCKHYQRYCQIVAPCCNKIYSCRLCHDAIESEPADDDNHHSLSQNGTASKLQTQ